MANYFYYFGYGSNLLKQRLQLRNPSAVFVKPARLENHKLSFGGVSNNWNGAIATVIEVQGEHVWGAVWRMDQEHRKTLDHQEQVSSGIYRPISVEVTAEDGERFQCLSYQLVRGSGLDKPSPHYKDVILRGATTSSLPGHYIEKLQQIQDNGYEGKVQLYEDVMRLLHSES